MWRAVELIKSLAFWESTFAWCVVIDDSPTNRGISELKIFPAGCQAITLTNLRQGTDWHWTSGLTATIVQALGWIQQETDAALALRIDADALVIGPFVDRLTTHVLSHPDAGLLGSIGLSCNPSVRVRQDLRRESKFVTALRLWPPAGSEVEKNTAPLQLPEFIQPITLEARRAFDTLRPIVEVAIGYGFGSWEYCQGGAVVITRRMLDAMACAGHFDLCRSWLALQIPDDLVLAMYANAVGLRMYDCSSVGDVFGLQHNGLPYTIPELISRRYALIHSVKNDRRYTEAYIRSFFWARAHSIRRDDTRHEGIHP